MWKTFTKTVLFWHMVSFMFKQVKCIKNILLNYLLSITIEHKSNIFGANIFFCCCLMRKFCTFSLNSLIWLTYVFLSILLRWYKIIMVYFCVCIFSKNIRKRMQYALHMHVKYFLLFCLKFYPFIICGNSNKH